MSGGAAGLQNQSGDRKGPRRVRLPPFSAILRARSHAKDALRSCEAAEEGLSELPPRASDGKPTFACVPAKFAATSPRSAFLLPTRWPRAPRRLRRRSVLWLACYDGRTMAGKRFIMNAGRTTKQGQQINVGKDSAEYQAIVSTLTMHPEDMKDGRDSAWRQRPGAVRIRRGHLQVRRGEGSAGDDLRPLRTADLPSHGPDTPTAPGCRRPRVGKSKSSRSRRRRQRRRSVA